MIIGIGVDHVDSRRIAHLIETFGNSFVQRIFTLQEQAYAQKSPHPFRVYANRFAAKEAVVKALGTGMRGGIRWQDIETLRTPSGAPRLYLYGKALEKLISLLPTGHKEDLHLSLSDEPPYSTAFVVIESHELAEPF